MQLLQMRYFVALAERENLAETAEVLRISRSTLSGAIGKFEKELGVELFEPAGRGMRLSESGKTLYCRLKPALAEIDLAIKETVPREDVGVLIGLPAAWSGLFIDFATKRPDVPLRTRLTSPHQVKSFFASNAYDFWITGSDITKFADAIDARELCASSVMLAVAETHPLANRNSVCLQELKDEPFLFPFSDYDTHRKYLEICRAGGFEPKIVGYGDFERRLKRIARNEGITFAECDKKDRNAFCGMKILEISDLPPGSPCYICSRKGYKLSSNARTFLDFALRYYQQD